MALPTSVETQQTKYLMEIVRNSSEPIINWPVPTKDDVILIGKTVMLYSYIDFNLRRMIECLDHAKKLPRERLGKTARMHIGDIETMLESAPDISPNNAFAFRQIKEFRKMRNLMAHFAVKRFPTENALVFLTKSASDYKNVLDAKPNPGVVMAGAASVEHMQDICKLIEGVQHWLSGATNDIENALLKSQSRPTRP